MKTSSSKELMGDITYLRQGIKQANEQIARLFRELTERIKGGESAGDDILNYSIAHFGEIGGERDKKLREIDNLIRKHEGELLLIVQYEENDGLLVKRCSDDHAKPSNIMGSVFGRKYPTAFWLGQITESGCLKVNAAGGTISFPVNEFVLWTGKNKPITRNSSGPSKEILALLFDTPDNFSLSAFNIMSSARHREATAELHIGTEKVLACFRGEVFDGGLLFYKMAHAVGYPEERMPKDILNRITTIKDEIRTRLIKADAAIQRILNSADKVRVKGSTVLLSGQALGEFKEHQQEISHLLVEAKELGMGNDSVVIKLLKQPDIMEEQTM